MQLHFRSRSHCIPRGRNRQDESSYHLQMTRKEGHLIILLVLALVCGCTPAQTDRVFKEGDLAPGFSITTDSGKHVSPEAFGGSLLVLNFWETSCVPCVEEMPSLSDFARKFRSEHVVVLAVGADEDARKYRRFLQDHSVTVDT